MLVFDSKNKDHIIKCIEIIRNGGIIVFPTDTIYGLGCDPYNDRAVEKIFQIKKRTKDKPLPLLAFDIKSAEKIISLNNIGKKLAQHFWPGPLTIVGKLIDKNISKSITAGKPKIGLRIPNNTDTLNLLNNCKVLSGTSANISNDNSNSTALEIMNSKLIGYDAILIGDDKEPKNPFFSKGSTIVDITSDDIQIIRQGAINSETIYEILKHYK
jgi:L-threonylcarbamoyladenylate synthase